MTKRQQMKADWGLKILKDIKKVVQLKSYQRTGYIGNGFILTCIVYEALGMRSKIQSMPQDEEVLQAIKSKRKVTQKQVRKKTLQVTSSMTREEDNEEQEPKVQVPVQKTITVGQKQIPMGSMPGPQPVKKIKFKLTTRRPREEELALIKGDITAKQPPK